MRSAQEVELLSEIAAKRVQLCAWRLHVDHLVHLFQMLGQIPFFLSTIGTVHHNRESIVVVQLDDDIELLDLMIKDHNEAPEEYNATGRWHGYSERFLVYLKEKGLHDFRRQRPKKDDDGYVLASFGARDLNSTSYGTPEELYHMANSCYLAEGARPIKCLHSSQVGNPEGIRNRRAILYALMVELFLQICVRIQVH